MATAVPAAPVVRTDASVLSPDRILQLAWGYAPPLVLEAAIKHRLFDELDAGPKSIAELNVATGCASRGLKPILNTLVGLGFLTKDESELYSLTPESAMFLVSHKATFQGGFIRHTR